MSAELALARLEKRVLAMGGLKSWLESIDTLKKLLAMGEPDVAKIVLAMSSPKVEAQALAAVLDAFALGAKDANAILRKAELDEVSRTGRPSKAAREPVKGIDKAGRAAMAKAHKLAKVGAEPAAILAPLFGHANRVRRSISGSINHAGNEGATAVADRAGLPTVWVAETDACVDCLAYSGKVAKPGKAFPGGLTYGKKSYHPDPIKTPPLHPHCRCTVEPLVAKEYAVALRREADRSVLRGFSLKSESMARRIDAADRLLDRGVDAPKSVIAYARNAVKRGAFTTRGRPNP